MTNMVLKSGDVCEVCGKPRYVILDVLGQEKKFPCKCECEMIAYEEEERIREGNERQIRIDKLRSHSLMDKNFWESDFAHWNDEHGNPTIKKICKAYVEHWQENLKDGIGILLYGGVGTGKSYAVFSIANELLYKGIPVMVTSAIGIQQKVKSTFGTEHGEADVIDSFNQADLLILDDLGAERATEWGNSILYQLIDDRYRSGNPMIITTNLPLESLRKKLASDGIERTYDRLVERCIPIQVKGKTIREGKGQQLKQGFLEELKQMKEEEE